MPVSQIEISYIYFLHWAKVHNISLLIPSNLGHTELRYLCLLEFYVCTSFTPIFPFNLPA